MGLKPADRFILFWTTLGTLGFTLIWFLPWRFQVNDDVIMMWLVSGAYTGEIETYAVFLHPVLSWTFAGLYTFLPQVNWYGATWFWVVGLSSFLLIVSVASFQMHFWLKNWFALFLLLMAFHFCFFSQFTLVAGFAAFSSISFWLSERRRKSTLLDILCLVLFTMAIVIRWESVALIGLGYGAATILTGAYRLTAIDFRRFALLIVVFLSFTGSKFYWESHSEYVDFLKFNKLRSAVIDHPIFRQHDIENRFSPGTDFYFFSRWYFEADHPTESELEEMKNELDSEFLSFQQFSNSFARLWGFQKMEAFKSFLILCILVFCFSAAVKFPKICSFFLIWISFFIIFNFLFLLQGRVIFLFFLSLLFPLFFGYVPEFKPSLAKFAVFLSLTLFLIHCSNFLTEARGRAISDVEISSLRSHIGAGIPLVFEGYHEHNSKIHYHHKNQVPFLTTGWLSRSPFQQKALQRFGLNSFGDFKEYALITPTINLEIVFPAYMQYAFGDFYLKDSMKTDNFVLLHFEKR
jgi:hypothetical protein